MSDESTDLTSQSQFAHWNAFYLAYVKDRESSVQMVKIEGIRNALKVFIIMTNSQREVYTVPSAYSIYRSEIPEKYREQNRVYNATECSSEFVGFAQS